MIDTLSLLPEDSQRRFDSRHRLVIAASQRAKQLMQGSRPFPTKFTKETTIALEEVLQGKVEFLIGADARESMKDAKQVGDGDITRLTAVSPALGEDAREIKKELSVYADDSVKPPTTASEE